jgi:hypothetical protein
MARILCSECETKIRSDWNHCSNCGDKLERLEKIEAELKQTKPGTYFMGIVLALLMVAPLINIINESDGSLLSRLKNRGVLAWNEDVSSNGLISAGQYTPKEAIMTATGSCTIWIFENEKSANDALDNYINDNLEFASAWSGVDEVEKTGVVLLTLEPKSYCSEEAGSILEWKLE